MRVVSSAVSVTAHVVLGVLAVLGTTRRARSAPAEGIGTEYFIPPAPRRTSPAGNAGGGLAISLPPLNPGTIPVPAPSIDGVSGLTTRFPVFVPSGPGPAGPADGVIGVLGEVGPQVLTGPLPVYPELLRQAGIQGRVVLEAIVDSGGRVVPASIAVVSATNPAFVAPARQALLATLFRPALVGGRIVAVHVRIPYDFTIRAAQSLWTSP